MSDVNQVEEDGLDNPVEDERTALIAKADLLGVKFHPSIGLDKLREKVNAALSDEKEKPEDAPAPATEETENQRRLRIRKKSLELQRIRITCMNPNKREWESELFECGNSVVNAKRVIPFNAEWHAERILVNMIQARMCQVFQTTMDAKGRKIRTGKLVKEFSVEILPNLTEKELKDLAQRQAMANGTAA